MKKALAYGLVFVLGAVVGQIALGALVVSFGPSGSRSFGVSDELLKERFEPVCERMRARGCSCEPVVFTENMCKADLDEIMRDRLFE